MMRRESRSFVVEKRRGPKRSAVVTTVEQPAPAAPPGESSLDEIFRRAEAALFDRSAASGAKPDATTNGTAPRSNAPASSTPPAAEIAPPRRILENLNEVDPLAALLAERGEPSRRGRKPGSKNKPKDDLLAKLDPSAIANLKGRLELTPERINEALKSMERVSAAASRNVKPAVVRAARPETIDEADEEEAFSPLAAAAPVATATASDDPIEPAARAKSRGRASIRGRYVVGSDLKPGERWKRRLRGAR